MDDDSDTSGLEIQQNNVNDYEVQDEEDKCPPPRNYMSNVDMNQNIGGF